MSNVGSIACQTSASPGLPGATGVVKGVGCYWGSPRRLVTDIQASGSTTATLYRFSQAYQAWVALGAAAAVGTTVVSAAWETDVIESYYIIVLADNTKTGTWQPIPGLKGP